MSMLDEIEKLMNSTNISANYRIIDVGGKFLYVEGIKNVVEFAENSMKFQLKKSLLVVEGADLKVKYLDKTTCVIEGEIFSVVTKWNLI